MVSTEEKKQYGDEKHVRTDQNDAPTTAPSSYFSSWFGGKGVWVGPRIAPVLEGIDPDNSGSDETSSAILAKQIEVEAGHAIKYRTCSWQKTAALLFSEYICLAIMSFPWSYSILGLVPGLILTVFVAGVVLYTSLVLWEFCLRHPEVRDICDIGQMLFWGKKWAWYATAFMFLMNNTFIQYWIVRWEWLTMLQALHVLVGSKYLDTMAPSDTGCRTVVYSVVTMIVCWLCSVPRTFSTLSKIGTFSAIFTFISVLLAAVFAGVEKLPVGYDPRESYTTPAGLKAIGGSPIVTALPVAGTTFVAALNAFLNISYTFIGQITLPSFIAEMEDPRDFPKALWACTIAEIIVFSIVGGVVYAYTGNQYMTAPAFGSLIPVYKKVAFSFMIPTIIFLGVLYASVSARFIFFRIFQNSRHRTEHTVTGWATWTAILLATWVLAFIIAEVIPFFSYLLSLMSSLFDSFFGFIFWGVAYFRMRRADGKLALVQDHSMWGYFVAGSNVVIILIGLFFLTAGTYVSVVGIVDEFEAGTVGSVFSCASRGV